MLNTCLVQNRPQDITMLCIDIFISNDGCPTAFGQLSDYVRQSLQNTMPDLNRVRAFSKTNSQGVIGVFVHDGVPRY
jgi:hypothetical protein